MEDDAKMITREQYIEMLIDASFQDAAEIEAGLLSWKQINWRMKSFVAGVACHSPIPMQCL